jgi:N-acetyl-ornithine/N-acetyl-lysine deacetylase
MVTIPSYSYQEQALARFLAERAREMGLYARVDEVGNFIAGTNEELVNRTSRENVGTAKEPIILLGHMDTVSGYIPVRVEGNRLYGRGTVDAKGPLAAFLCVTARLARNANNAHPVLVIGAVQEEAATSLGARAVVERYRPSACIIGEPSGSRAVTIGYKGRLLVEARATQSMSHSAGPERTSSERATAFWERVRLHAQEENSHTESAFSALMPSLRRIDHTHDGFEEQTTLLIGYRLPPDFDIADLRQQLEQWAHEDNIHLTVSGEEQAFQTTRTTPLARSFISAMRETGSQATFKHKTGTSDMNVVGPIWGNSIVAYGPGDSRLDHTPDEHIELDEYAHAIDVLEQVLRTLTTAPVQEMVLAGRNDEQ